MKPLNIAIVGLNAQISDRGFRQFIENNREQVRNISYPRRVARLNDGTTIETILSTDDRELLGKRIDQLIIFGDHRINFSEMRIWDIEKIKELTMHRSIIPEEFQILRYKDLTNLHK